MSVNIRTTTVQKPDRRFQILSVVLAVLLLAAMVPAVLYFWPAARPAIDVRFDIAVPEMPNPWSIAISPDGRRVAYAAATVNRRRALWVRPINSLDAQMLPGTEGAEFPFWSPDSRFIAFAVRSELKRIDASGGVPQTLADLPAAAFNGTWNRSGVIVVAAGNTGLHQVSESGGEATAVTELDSSLEERYHAGPWFLPDGRHFLYSAWSNKPENRAIYIGSLDSKTRARLMTADSVAIYAAPGFIVFRQEGTLMGRPFDSDRLEFTGEALPLAEGVGFDETVPLGPFSVSNEGTLIYRSGGRAVRSWQLSWIDRTGKTSGPIGAPIRTGILRLSPDSKRVALYEPVPGGLADLWVYDLERDLRTRLTTDPANEDMPVWSSDGSRLIFDSSRGENPREYALYEQPSNGASPERLLLQKEPGMTMFSRDWSMDGRWLIFSKRKTEPGSPRDLWVLPLTGDRKPFPYLVDRFNKGQAVLSPNARWLAHTTNESGKHQVVVQPFPDPSGGKWQISTSGGAYPRWRRDGRELYYMEPDGRIIAVSVTTDRTFEIGKTTPLFETSIPFPPDPSGASYPYDVAADGQRFLIAAPLTNAAPITVVMNWTALLKK